MPRFDLERCSQSSTSSAMTISVDVFSIDEDQLKCPICGYLFRQPVRLDCGHSFCKNCIDKWLRSCNSCSICRQPTLEPRRNFDLEKIIEKRKPGSSASTRSGLLQRTLQPIRRVLFPKPAKEAQQLQRESLRASMRRVKRVNVEERLRRLAEKENKEMERKRSDWETTFDHTRATGFERNLLRRSVRRLKQFL